MDELKTLRERAQFYEGGEILVDAEAILSLLDRLEKAEAELARLQIATPTAFAMLPPCTCFSEQQEKYCLRQRKCSKAVAQLDKQEMDK